MSLAAADPADAVLVKHKTTLQGTTAQVLLAATSGGGEGGEGGEGAAAREGDADFLAALGFIEGHLRAGFALEDRSVKAAAGDAVLYPSNPLHRVEPVTAGERLAVVGWATSWVREPERREVLFDLEMSLSEIHAAEGKSALFDRIAKTRTNLLRMWADG